MKMYPDWRNGHRHGLIIEATAESVHFGKLDIFRRNVHEAAEVLRDRALESADKFEGARAVRMEITVAPLVEQEPFPGPMVGVNIESLYDKIEEARDLLTDTEARPVDLTRHIMKMIQFYESLVPLKFPGPPVDREER